MEIYARNHPAEKMLKVWVAFPGTRYALISKIIHVLQQYAANHQPDGDTGDTIPKSV